eukprot:1649095-Prymnesium_polylepis.1
MPLETFLASEGSNERELGLAMRVHTEQTQPRTRDTRSPHVTAYHGTPTASRLAVTSPTSVLTLL